MVRFTGVVLLLVTVIGCSAPVGDLSGTVSFKGEPLPAGRISFLCEGGEKPVLSSDIQDGKYAIHKAPGGSAKVIVQTFKQTSVKVPNQPANLAPIGDDQPKQGGGKYVAIPERYSKDATSGLSVTIKGGAQTENFELKP